MVNIIAVVPQAKQRDKVLALVNNRDSQMLFTVWLTVLQLIMALHFSLFKRGRFFSHMEQRDAERRFACFEFCRGPEANPAAKTLTGIANILLAPDGAGRAHLRLIHGIYGGVSANWPLVLMGALQITAVLAFARFWRLLYHCFLLYPWRLAPIFDPEAPEDLKRDRIREFLAIPRGSKKLDPGLGRKLRDIVETEADLLEESLHKFMQALFLRVVVTSTHVERIFSSLTKWTSAQGQEVASIAGKYFNTAFNECVGRWRNSVGAGASTSGKCRPVWMKSTAKGSRQTGLHVYAESVPKEQLFNGTVAASWRNLSESDRKHYEGTAARRRRIASVRLSPLDQFLERVAIDDERSDLEGPWSLSTRDGEFSVHEDVVRKAFDERPTMRAISQAWVDRVKATIDNTDGGFPASVPFDGPVGKEIPLALQDVCRRMLEMLRLAIRFEDCDDDAGFALEFRRGDHRIYCFAAHSSHIERESFLAELFHMHVQDNHAHDDAPDALPMVLAFSSERSPTGDPWPRVQTEVDFVVGLAEIANEDWTLSTLRSRPRSMHTREVYERRQLEPDKLRELEADLLEQRRVMSLHRYTLGRGRSGGRGGRGGGRRGAGKGRGHGRGRAAGRGARGRGVDSGGGGASIDEGASDDEAGGGDAAKVSNVAPPECDVSSEDEESDDDGYGGVGDAIMKLKTKLKSLFIAGPGAGDGGIMPCPGESGGIMPCLGEIGDAVAVVEGSEGGEPSGGVVVGGDGGDGDGRIVPDAPVAIGGAARARAAADRILAAGPIGYRARPRERVLETWGGGRHPFAEVAPGGIVVGFGVHCGRHCNADGTVYATACKKMVTMGDSGMTHAEARIRLKRWLVAGKTTRLDPDRERQAHVGLGGLHLRGFASDGGGWGDITEDELDMLLAA